MARHEAILVQVPDGDPFGSPEPVGADNPIQVVQADYVDKHRTWTIRPVISTGAYTAADALGGLLTFPGATRRAGLGGTILTVAVLDLTKQSAATDLVLFKKTFAATTDNAAFDPTDADAGNCIGFIPIAATDYAVFNDWSVACVRNVRFDYRLEDGTDLFGQLVTRGTPTYALGELVLTVTAMVD